MPILSKNQLTSQLVGLWLPNGEALWLPELVSGVGGGALTIGSSAAGVGQPGLGISLSGSKMSGGGAYTAISGSLTVLVFLSPNVVTGINYPVARLNGTPATDQFQIVYGQAGGGLPEMYGSDGTSYRTSNVGSTAMVAGGTYVICGTIQANSNAPGNSTISVYLNGILQNSNTLGFVLNNAPTVPYVIGDRNDSSGPITATVYLAAAWDRSLSYFEVFTLSQSLLNGSKASQNPWLFYYAKKVRPPLFAITVSSGLTAIGSSGGFGGGIATTAVGSGA